jgi:hypothetical protein
LILGPEELFEQHCTSGLLLDTNLLIFYVVGSHDRSQIGRQRLSSYTVDDFKLLTRFVSGFRRMVTTPHILTEVSNLLGSQSFGDQSVSFFEAFAAQIGLLHEEQPVSARAASRSEFPFLGLTDCVLAELSTSFFVLSNDARMVIKLHEAGLNAVNFNHFRSDLQALL